VQKKYKKRFFVNNKKYFLSLALVSLFFSYQNIITKEKTTSQSKQNSTETASKDLAQSCDSQQKPKKSNAERNGVINKIIAAPRCPHGSIPIRKMTIDQLNDVYAYSQNHTLDLYMTVSLLERLIALSDNHTGVKMYKLQLADTHFQLNHIDIAAMYYEDFSTLYPASKEAEYALYKAVLCMFEISLEPDRDQTNSKKTILLAKEFLKKSPKIEFQQEIQTVLENCYERLYDHEVYVFNFYKKRKKFESARMRLDFIQKTFDKVINDLDHKVQLLSDQLELAIHPVKAKKSTLVQKRLG